MIYLIVAVQEDGGIGYQNQLLWKFREDMRFFKEKTVGNVVIMGNNTYKSIGNKPLKDRINAVLTSKEIINKIDENDVYWFNSLTDAIDYFLSEKEKDIYIIGGASVYKETLNKKLVNEGYITVIGGQKVADTYFPISQIQYSETLREFEENGVKCVIKHIYFG